jgi:hypothetical protein
MTRFKITLFAAITAPAVLFAIGLLVVSLSLQ